MKTVDSADLLSKAFWTEGCGIQACPGENLLPKGKFSHLFGIESSDFLLVISPAPGGPRMVARPSGPFHTSDSSIIGSARGSQEAGWEKRLEVCLEESPGGGHQGRQLLPEGPDDAVTARHATKR